jgi:hypothetical protein
LLQTHHDDIFCYDHCAVGNGFWRHCCSTGETLSFIHSIKFHQQQHPLRRELFQQRNSSNNVVSIILSAALSQRHRRERLPALLTMMDMEACLELIFLAAWRQRL